MHQGCVLRVDRSIALIDGRPCRVLDVELAEGRLEFPVNQILTSRGAGETVLSLAGSAVFGKACAWAMPGAAASAATNRSARLPE